MPGKLLSDLLTDRLYHRIFNGGKYPGIFSEYISVLLNDGSRILLYARRRIQKNNK